MTQKIDLNPFLNALQTNCDISDAGGAGIFSICGMALRLRDLNKWEKGLNPWEENHPERLVKWIDEKEQLWEKIEGAPFSPLPLLGRIYDPFDTKAINRVLTSQNLFYGAGYAHSLKPTFFLAEIEQAFDLHGNSVLILGRERARDLLTIPALNQDNRIIIRRESASLFLWDQMVYLKKSGRRFLHYALKKCRLPDTSLENRKIHFPSILSVQEQTYMHHELGEITDTVFDHQTFREIVSAFPHTPVELLARTVKDLLADTGPKGTLTHIIKTKNSAGLGFYAAFQDGLFKPLFPQLRQAFEKFASDQDWDGIEKARITGFDTAQTYTRELINIFLNTPDQKDREKTADTINKKLIEPLLAI